MTSSCPAAWIEINSQCYGFLKADSALGTYAAAETMCKDEGGTTASLAVITAAEVALINNSLPSDSTQYFIGVNDLDVCNSLEDELRFLTDLHDSVTPFKDT